MLFDTRRSREPVEDREVLLLKFSSSIDLFDYFASWQRMIQVRCHVDGSENGRAYTGFGWGPYEAGIDISRLRRPRGDAPPSLSGSSGGHEYSIYAFPDLIADDEVYKNGEPRSHMHLDTDRWSNLGCYVIGVTKAPVLFPRSNDLLVNAEQFNDLVRASRSE
jgi:hypothetical protein